MSDNNQTQNPLEQKLKDLGVEDEFVGKIVNDLGANKVEDLNGLTETDLTGIGMKPLRARNIIGILQKQNMSSATHAANTAGAFAYDSILPSVPDDASWLSDLKSGGVLKVDQSTVISAVRAALAHRAGLFRIPELLVDAMEKFADANDEQVDPIFFKLRKQLTKRSYGDIFSAIEGMDGTYVTEPRKKHLLGRIDNQLWGQVVAFNGTLKNWYESWASGAANPAMMMGMLMSASGGGVGMALPPGMMQPPDTGVLRDEAAAVNDAINKVFAGTGVQIVAALAYDATQIRETLKDSRLPALIGAANREAMLRQLGVAVSPAYPRMEINLTRFVLGIMEAQNIASGNEELQFFGSLYMLGSQIPWDQLEVGTGRKVTGIGGGRL